MIQKSIPVFNSRTNVNKLSGLVRPSSGYYSYNTDVDKFEAVNNVSYLIDLFTFIEPIFDKNYQITERLNAIAILVPQMPNSVSPDYN